MGFAAETNDVLERGRRKLQRKGVDLLVVNDVSAPGVGFDHDTNAVTILGADGTTIEIALTSKNAVADAVLDRVIAHQRAESEPPVKTTFTSESVTEGHPDKMADQISDAVLDAMLEGDPASRVACETLLTTGLVVVAGEVTTSTYVDIAAIVRETVCDIGYDNDAYGFNGHTCGVLVSLDAPVARHRPGRGLGLRVPHRHRRRGHAQRPGRRRPGNDVRLRLRRDARPDAAADLAGPPPVRAPGPGPARRRRCPTCAPTARPRCSVVYEDGRPVGSTPCSSRPSTHRASTSKSSCCPT